MKKVKEEYKGTILSSPKLPVDIVAGAIKDNEIEFYEKMGFGFLFEEVKKPAPKKSTKRKKKSDD